MKGRTIFSIAPAAVCLAVSFALLLLGARGAWSQEPIGVKGACCIGNQCEVISEAECLAQGGTYAGNNTLCTALMCIGGCCLPGNLCTNSLDEQQCEVSGGVYLGNGNPCGPDSCTGTGACCFADTTCTDGITHPQCVNAGGSFQGSGTTCTLGFCPGSEGACCLPDESCDVILEGLCAAAGGVFFGTGSSCGAVACGCTGDLDGDGAVGVTDLLDLLDAWGDCPGTTAGGVAGGGFGACCAGGGCQSTSQANCEAIGGEFFPNSFCAIGMCPEDTGACCFPGGTCSATVNSAQCAAGGGTFFGVGTVCSADICTPCVGDLDDDGSVGVTDLLILLDRWGPCP